MAFKKPRCAFGMVYRLTILALCLLFDSCKLPVGSPSPRASRANLALTFVISGVRQPTRQAAVAAGSQPRLILPTAASLRISLQAQAGGEAIVPEPTAIGAGSTTVPVSLTGIPFGTYTVKAEAFDGNGVLRFFQTATAVVVGSETASVRLNLVPAGASGAELVSETLHDINLETLAAGESQAWLLAPGSRLLAARSIFLSGLNSDMEVFLQSADGQLRSQASGAAARLSTVALPAGQAAYLTVYNGGSAALATGRVFPGAVMVAVPGGAFQRDASPANVSRVSEFSLASLEVSRELYQLLMGADPSDVSVSTDSGDPAQNVNWYRALAFCNKLSLVEGLTPVYAVPGITDWAALPHGNIPTTDNMAWNAAGIDMAADGYRLPTEMEWWWAAMGATQDSLPGAIDGEGINRLGSIKGYSGSSENAGGQTNIDSYASYAGNSAMKTLPGGSKLPNELGLYDMSGNVAEWCWDRTNILPSGQLTDYLGPAGGSSRILRGGGYSNVDVASLQLDIRSAGELDVWLPQTYIGIRVARGPVPTHTVSYHANGATSGTAPAAVAVHSGQTHTVAGNTGNLSKPGLMFAGWSTASNGSGTPYNEGSWYGVETSTITLYARWANFVENVEGLTVGSNNLHAQNGWVADTTGGTSTQVVGGHGVNSTKVIGSAADYRLSSHALGGSIDMSDPQKAYRLLYDSVKPAWGTHFGIAADMNTNGVIEAGEDVWNFRVDNSGDPANLAYLVRPSGEISTSIAAVLGLDYNTWFQTELYFTQGNVTIRVKPWSTGVWTTVWADISLETTANSDKTNPANWSHVYFSMASTDGYVDNISFETINLP